MCVLLLALFNAPGFASEAKASSPMLAGSVAPPVLRQNAYATIMHCGTIRDYDFLIALRVMLKTLVRTKPEANIVVFISKTCPEHYKEIYAGDGLRVLPVDNMRNPYKERFTHALNKLLAWRLEEYNRVVMLDVDNVFLRNADELFQCGEFCAVFVNPCFFHTGLFVLKTALWLPNGRSPLQCVQEVELAVRAQQRECIPEPAVLQALVLVGLALPTTWPHLARLAPQHHWAHTRWRHPSLFLPLALARLSKYGAELTTALLQAMAYGLLLAASAALRHRFSVVDRAAAIRLLLRKGPCASKGGLLSLCYLWASKAAIVGLATIGFLFVPIYFVPPFIHPFFEWGLLFHGWLSLDLLLASALALSVAAGAHAVASFARKLRHRGPPLPQPLPQSPAAAAHCCGCLGAARGGCAESWRPSTCWQIASR
eukprot:jgi/Mesen1/10587/ME000085S09925